MGRGYHLLKEFIERVPHGTSIEHGACAYTTQERLPAKSMGLLRVTLPLWETSLDHLLQQPSFIES